MFPGSLSCVAAGLHVPVPLWNLLISALFSHSSHFRSALSFLEYSLPEWSHGHWVFLRTLVLATRFLILPQSQVLPLTWEAVRCKSVWDSVIDEIATSDDGSLNTASKKWLHIAEPVVMDCISKHQECVHRNFRTGGSFICCQNGIFDIGIRGYKTHWVKILCRARTWTGWPFWVPPDLRDSMNG